MRSITLNGTKRSVRVLREEDLAPGTLVCGREFRSAYRIVCEDEGQLVLRNLRRPNLLVAWDPGTILEACDYIE